MEGTMKALAVYEGGVHEKVEAAIGEDMGVYKRSQFHDPRYGYRWTRWEWVGDVTEIPEAIGHGFYTLRKAGFYSRMVGRDGKPKVRLPND
jgi:hypothetical protein